ncbi:single-stranded DNA-binding protein [Candidatus Peregrinibacteria bacterium]|nr:single-stranded DNA-binding protein [Candidatus Peregrinibacteria bacterium]
MRSVNKVILIGNLTRDPEMRQTPSGQAVCTFSIATNREWVTKDGSKHSLTEYHDLVSWAKLAEICDQNLKKGKLIYVEGYLKTRSWETPEGVKKFKTEIVIQDLIMLNKRDESYSDENEYVPSEEDESFLNNDTENNNTTDSQSTTNSAPEADSDKKKNVDIESDLGL